MKQVVSMRIRAHDLPNGAEGLFEGTGCKPNVTSIDDSTILNVHEVIVWLKFDAGDPLVMTVTGPAVAWGLISPTGQTLIGSKSGYPPFPLPTPMLPEGPFVDEPHGIMRHNYRPDSPLNQVKENISRHRLQQAHGEAYHKHAFKCRERDAERIARAGGRWSY